MITLNWFSILVPLKICPSLPTILLICISHPDPARPFFFLHTSTYLSNRLNTESETKLFPTFSLWIISRSLISLWIISRCLNLNGSNRTRRGSTQKRWELTTLTQALSSQGGNWPHRFKWITHKRWMEITCRGVRHLQLQECNWQKMHFQWQECNTNFHMKKKSKN